jgi:hypothetical protein
MTIGKASSLREGVEIATRTVDSGRAGKTLEDYVSCTNRLGGAQ